MHAGPDSVKQKRNGEHDSVIAISPKVPYPSGATFGLMPSDAQHLAGAADGLRPALCYAA